MALSLTGETRDGDARGLAFGVAVTFSAGTAQIFTVPTGQNAVITAVVFRNKSGTMPVSLVVGSDGGSITGTITTATLLPGTANILVLNSAVPVLGGGQSMTVTPLTNTSGGGTFDVLGYMFTS